MKDLSGLIDPGLGFTSKPNSAEQIPLDEVYIFPASFAQQRLWFLDSLKPGSPVYNICEVFRLRGSLNLRALEDAINEIIKRHEVLRTSFAMIDGEPMQVVTPELKLKLNIVQLQQLSVPDQEAETARLISKEARQPFDLSNLPLLRITLLSFRDDDHILIFTIHHIAFDGWSQKIFVQELAEIYKASANGIKTELPALKIQYGDFAVWQRDWMKGEVLTEQLAYWKKYLDGAPAKIELPLDRPRPAVQSFQGAIERFTIPNDLYRRLLALSHELGATLFMVLLAAFKTLLYRYTSQEDIVVGVPHAGRNRQETENLIGFFVNTIVLRSDLSGNPSFRDLVKRLKEATLEVYDHSNVPFERVVQELHPERSLSFTPLIQVMFVLQNNASAALSLDQVQITSLKGETGTSKFDLTLEIYEEGDRLECLFEYNTDVFEANTIKRMIGHYQEVVTGILSQPDTSIAHIPILSPAERTLLLDQWNTRIAASVKDCVHRLFEEQVAKTPNAIALSFEGRHLTYSELNQRANQMAHFLIRNGASPDTFVGIFMDRSIEMIVTILGVLKAGAAYVPIDFTYPQERIDFMIADSGISLLLTQKDLSKRFRESKPRVISVDVNFQLLKGEPTDNPVTDVHPNHLCYLIYTSGSTGKPKGVQITHDNVVRLFSSTERWFQFNETDVWTFFHSYAFDFSVWELWGALIHGGSVVLVPYLVSRSPDQFYSMLVEEKVTVLNQTPSAFMQLIEAQERTSRSKYLSLRFVIFGGEALDVHALKRWFERNGDIQPRLINMYGITETTVHVTYKPLEIVDSDAYTGSPIGVRIPDLEVYVLDQNMEPVPIGVVGEIYVGGAGVARGYLDRPDLNLERFITNPFSQHSDSRLYKSGDRARYLENGELEFFGRSDFQVKIRGFRIELGEIESVLLEHSSVRNCIVLAQGEASDKRLIAYLVPKKWDDQLPQELRSYLKEKLPEYMVPSSFMLLEGLPLTLNGKVDRAALPLPETATLASQADFDAPRDQLELQLAKMWEVLLNVQPVGINDNFFEIGGHSLVAVRLFTEIEKIFGRTLSVASLFRAPTVAELARILQDEGLSSSWSCLVPIQIHGRKPPFYAIHAGGGHVLFYRDLAKRLGNDQPFYALQAQGLDGKLPRHKSVDEMAEHYIREIRNLQPQGPYHIGGASFGGLVAYEMAYQLQSQGCQVGVVALFDTHAPGYPVYLSSKQFLPSEVYSIARRVQHHVQNLLVSDWNQKIPYLIQKMQKAKKLFRRSLMRNLRKLAGIRNVTGWKELPKSLQQTQNSIEAANESYEPKNYIGRITVFRATKQPYGIQPDRTLGWSKYSSNIKIYDVAGYHGAIISEPRVAVTAEILKDRLDKEAQS